MFFGEYQKYLIYLIKTLKIIINCFDIFAYVFLSKVFKKAKIGFNRQYYCYVKKRKRQKHQKQSQACKAYGSKKE